MDDERIEVYFLDPTGPMANWKGDGTHDNPYVSIKNQVNSEKYTIL